MRILAEMSTDLVWCDIGGPNLTARFAAEYFNNAKNQGRQVSINNRCGTKGDFDTATYATLQRNRKWERTASLDPFSYGYNRATPDDAYMKPEVIVTRLIEAVSMNGNFLLNVGPTAEGMCAHGRCFRALRWKLWYKNGVTHPSLRHYTRNSTKQSTQCRLMDQIPRRSHL